MTITFASLFTGGGGADIGATQAGLTPIWGIEKEGKIFEVASRNMSHDHQMFLSDVRDFDWNVIKPHNRPDWLHASPPCVNASTANNGKETQEDISLAQAICRAIETLKPQYFSLENVAGYKYYKSFKLINDELIDNLGYFWDWQVLDAYWFGVPQNRKRLFLVASRNQFAHRWIKVSREKSHWYDAIADLIPTLPECKLTESQKKRLFDEFEILNINHLNPARLPNLAIQNSGSRKDKDGNPKNTIRLAKDPVWTIRAMSGNVRPNPHQATLIVDGKVLRPTIQCYARWQTFPDDYQWSEDFKLNMRICGNAVPPKFFAQLIKGVISGT